jgi:hypothetical protein
MSRLMITSFKLLGIAGLLSAGLLFSARAQQPAGATGETLPPGSKLVKIEADPPGIDLQHPFDYVQLVLKGHLDNGDVVDVTRQAKLVQGNELVTVSDRGLVRPTKDGKATLTFAVLGHNALVPVTVSHQKTKHDVSFVKDVMPVLSKVGCNAGTCHGAAQGRNGFQLSLRGYDPVFDHRALTDDVQGRRFNRAAPDKSLMLMKPAGEVPHVGGVLTKPGEPYYELIRLWIAEGVKLDLKAPRVQSIAILPGSITVPLPGMKQQMRVVATYSDGVKRDVSAEAFVESSNIEIATVDKQGLVTVLRRGETAIMARYEGNYTAATLVVMGDRSGFAWKDVPENNYVDRLVYDKLKQVKVLPSQLCSDEEFIRRIYLDLTGLPPEPDQLRAFLADLRPQREKRDDLVDQLIGSPEFIEHWTNKWADLLQVNTKFLGGKGADAFRKWIKLAIADNMPYNQFVYTILTASGSNVENPPAAYFKILYDPASAMENTTHLFLAVRFNCNKCHDHPFERWTQNQYYTMSAFFAQIGHEEDPKYKGQKIGGSAVEGARPLVEIIKDKTTGEVKNERTGQNAQANFPFTIKDMPSDKESRRLQLAKWITSKDNPYFAKSYVNRIWSYLLGVGLIEPVDDIRAGNPPTNPKLLEKLTEEFMGSGYNVRALMRTICKSRTYQHSVETNKWNRDDNVNYSHALARRLPAEVLYDTIFKVTGSTSKLPGLPAGARAAQLLDPSTPVPGGFLEQFGKPARESSCECERSNAMLLGPVLNLVNGPVLSGVLNDPSNRISKLVAREKDDAKVIEELFLAILCRPPTASDLKACLAIFQNNGPDYQKLLAEHARRVQVLKDYEAELPAKQAAWEADQRKTTKWTVLDFDDARSMAGTLLTKQGDLSILASDKNPTPETYVLTVKAPAAGITGYRLEVLADPSLPGKGPGRAANGNFVLNEFKVFYSPDGDPKKFKEIKLTNAKATFSQEGFTIGQAIDGNPDSGWAIVPQLGKDQTAVFEGRTKGGTEGGVYKFEMLQKFNSKLHNVGKFRISVSTQKPPLYLQVLPENIAKIVNAPVEARQPAEQQELAKYYRSLDQELRRLEHLVAELQVPLDARAMAAQDVAWALMNTEAFLFNH